MLIFHTTRKDQLRLLNWYTAHVKLINWGQCWDPWNGFLQTAVEPRLSNESCWNFDQSMVFGPKLFIPSCI